MSPILAAGERFPKYAQAAAEAGIRSQVGLRFSPEPSPRRAEAPLHQTKAGPFDDFEALGALCTTKAGVAMGYAGEISNLTCTAIGQAVGVVMERCGMTDRAFAFVTRMSQDRTVELRLATKEG